MKYYIQLFSKWYAFVRKIISCEKKFLVVDKKGLRGDIPLYYITQEEKIPDEILVMNETDQVIYQASLRGNAFEFDKK